MSAAPHSCVIGERPSVMLGRWLRKIRVGISLLAVTACASAATSGQAADYSVAYGLDLNGIRDTGVLNECNIKQLCKISDTRSDVVILVSLNHVDDPLAFLSILGRRQGCCFFNGGSENTFVDASKKLISVPIFAGRKIRGNEVVVGNTSVGMLWLSFSIVPKPRPQTGSEKGPIWCPALALLSTFRTGRPNWARGMPGSPLQI